MIFTEYWVVRFGGVATHVDSETAREIRVWYTETNSNAKAFFDLYGSENLITRVSFESLWSVTLETQRKCLEQEKFFKKQEKEFKGWEDE